MLIGPYSLSNCNGTPVQSETESLYKTSGEGVRIDSEYAGMRQDFVEKGNLRGDREGERWIEDVEEDRERLGGDASFDFLQAKRAFHGRKDKDSSCIREVTGQDGI